MAHSAPCLLQHDTSRKMLGAEWSGKQSITVNERDVPMVTDPVSRQSLTYVVYMAAALLSAPPAAVAKHTRFGLAFTRMPLDVATSRGKLPVGMMAHYGMT